MFIFLSLSILSDEAKDDFTATVATTRQMSDDDGLGEDPLGCEGTSPQWSNESGKRVVLRTAKIFCAPETERLTQMEGEGAGKRSAPDEGSDTSPMPEIPLQESIHPAVGISRRNAIRRPEVKGRLRISFRATSQLGRFLSGLRKIWDRFEVVSDEHLGKLPSEQRYRKGVGSTS